MFRLQESLLLFVDICIIIAHKKQITLWLTSGVFIAIKYSCSVPLTYLLYRNVYYNSRAMQILLRKAKKVSSHPLCHWHYQWYSGIKKTSGALPIGLDQLTHFRPYSLGGL